MADHSAFSFLGEDLLNSQLSDFASLIRDHFPQSVQTDTVLAKKLDKFSARQDTWPHEIIKSYKNRNPPVYSVEDIVSINNAHITDIEQINKIRQNRVDTFSAQLKSVQQGQTKKTEKLAEKQFRLKEQEDKTVIDINFQRIQAPNQQTPLVIL